jgi:hypothetical protein
MLDTPILIAGAGPTGLVLAISLARRGVPFRLVSDAKGPGEHSRAMGVQAQTLEFYRQLGFADEVVERGIKPETLHLREGRTNGTPRDVLNMKFSDLGEGISPYPFMLTYPQDDHERFLIDKLASAGGRVEWETKLTGLSSPCARPALAGRLRPTSGQRDRTKRKCLRQTGEEGRTMASPRPSATSHDEPGTPGPAIAQDSALCKEYNKPERCSTAGACGRGGGCRTSSRQMN